MQSDRNRDGRTFLVAKDRRVYYAKEDGDDAEAWPPAHYRLAKTAGLSVENDIIAGGAVQTGFKVSWKSGSCTFSPEVKKKMERGQLSVDGGAGPRKYQLRNLELYARAEPLQYLSVDFQRLGLDDDDLTTTLDAISAKISTEVGENWMQSSSKAPLSFLLSVEDCEVLEALKHRAEVIIDREGDRLLENVKRGNARLAEHEKRMKDPQYARVEALMRDSEAYWETFLKL